MFSNVVALSLSTFFAWDLAFYATGFGRRLTTDLLASTLGAMVLTTLPALAMAGRWPWPALGLAFAYPLAWLLIMRLI